MFSTSFRGQLLKALFVVAAAGVTFGVLREKGYVSFGERDADRLIYAKFQQPEARREAAAYTQYLYGLLYEHRGFLSDAVRKFRAAKSFDPQSILTRVHLGVNLVHLDQKPDAAHEFEEASRLSPEDVKVKIVTALLFAHQGQYEEAAAQFRSVLAVEPDHAFAISSLADLYVLTNELDRAVEFYSRLAELRPRSPAVRFNLAVIESRLGNFEAAQGHLEETVRMRPKHLESWIALGLVFEAQKKFPESIAAFRRALDLDPADVRIYHNLARLHYNSGDIDQSIVQYGTLLQLKPDDPNATLDLAFLLIERGEIQKALQTIDRSMRRGVTGPKILFMKGYALGRMSDLPGEERRKEAVQAFRDALVLDPNYGEAHFYLGVLLEREKDYESAKYHFRRTIDIDPTNAEAYNYLGYIDIDRGQNLDEAIHLVEKALSLDPDNAAFLDSLGWAYYKKGIYARAVSELERAVAIDDKDPMIREHLTTAKEKLIEHDQRVD